MSVNTPISAPPAAGGTAREARVFAIHEPHTSRDVKSAERFGRVTFLLAKEDNPSIFPGPAANKLAQRLSDLEYDPSIDYIMWAGGDSMAMLMAGIIIAKHHPDMQRLRYLRWDRDINDKTVGAYREGEIYVKRWR